MSFGWVVRLATRLLNPAPKPKKVWPLLRDQRKGSNPAKKMVVMITYGGYQLFPPATTFYVFRMHEDKTIFEAWEVRSGAASSKVIEEIDEELLEDIIDEFHALGWDRAEGKRYSAVRDAAFYEFALVENDSQKAICTNAAFPEHVDHPLYGDHATLHDALAMVVLKRARELLPEQW